MTGRILRVLLMPDVRGIAELVLNWFVAWVGVGGPDLIGWDQVEFSSSERVRSMTSGDGIKSLVE